MKPKIIGIMIGAALLVTIVCLSECVHTTMHRVESKVEAYYCADIRQTIIEELHARRGLSCGSVDGKILNDIYNAANNIAEIDILTLMHRDAKCNTEQLFIDIMKHIDQCDRCKNYVKCGE